MTERASYVYFIEAIGADAIKIGWAVSPEKRLVQHAIGCPLELKLLCKAPGTLGHEGALQTRFSKSCIRGEWYHRSPALNALIEHVTCTGKLPADVVPAPKLSEAERPGIIPLLRCIAILGSQTAVARIIGTTPANVSNNVQQSRRPPALWCIKLEAATLAAGSPVWRDEIRPDLYPVKDLEYLHPLRRKQLLEAA